MKKLLSLILFLSFLTIGNYIFAQDEVIQDSVESVSDTSVIVEENLTSEVVETSEEEEEIIFEEEESKGFHQAIKEQFIQGDGNLWVLILLCLILGLAVSIERIITLNLATSDTKKLLSDVDDALKNKGGINSKRNL